MAFAPLAFIDGLGGPEMLLVFVIVLLLFGGQKLPEFARGLGKTMREFKKAAAGVEDEFKRALEEDERKKNDAALTAAATTTAALPAPADATNPAPDPYPDYTEHDPYHDEDLYSEAGPEAPAATDATSGTENPNPESPGSTEPAGPASETSSPAPALPSTGPEKTQPPSATPAP